MSLSDSERSRFYDEGVLPLKSVVPKPALRTIKAAILSEMERLKLSKLRDLPPFQQTGRLAQMIDLESELDSLITEDLSACMNSLAGAVLKPSHPHPQLLLSLPHKESWSLARLSWHLDLAVPERDEVPGVQAFVLIDDVNVRGGATLALAGSHKLPYRRDNRSKTAKGALLHHRVFSGLFDGSGGTEACLQSQLVNGIATRVVEMYGKAGDVFLMDMRVLHSPSVNSTKNIRMMATNRFLKS